MTAQPTRGEAALDRYAASLLGVFGRPKLVLESGQGCRVTDTDGRTYLDLLGGIAVSALGHGHPDLVAAIADQAQRLIHVSNFFTTEEQVALAERLLAISGAPEGSAVFFTNSGAESNEAAIKLSRRTGRTQIVVAEGAFHGRSTGAVALTGKAAYREPFEPLIPGVVRVPYNDVEALRSAVTDATAAVLLEPIQGEAGVVPASAAYLRAARELTSAHGALLIMDEVQTGVARTGDWFAFSQSGIQPDAMTLAKGLGGGVPIGALVTFGAGTTALLRPGQHGTTFGGGPLACAAGLAVLDVIERDDLCGNAARVGDYLADQVEALGDARIATTRGRGLLRAIELAQPICAEVAVAAQDAGFIVNAPTPTCLRLAPALVLTEADVDEFVAALPAILSTAADAAAAKETTR
ncbi:acetylornithine transaminase [Actinomycetota bacterium]